MFIMIQKCSIWRVSSIFFLEPLKVHYIKEISKKINLAPTSVRKHILELLKDNIVIKKKQEHFSGFIANRENQNFLFYKRIYNLTQIKETGLEDFLIKSLYPQVIVLYGSYLRGEDIEKSDIDIVIISKVKKELDIEKFESMLKRRVHLIIINDIKKLKKEIILEVINGMVLYGYLSV